MKQRGVAKPIMKTPVETVKPEIPKKEELAYNPGYYVSRMTKHMVEDALEKKTISRENLGYIFKIAKTISQIFNLQQPTYYDVAAAMKMHTPEKLRAVAEGSIEIEVFRPEFGRRSDQPKAERIALWKGVAKLIDENLA